MSTKKIAVEQEHATRVRSMFANISARYDLLNHLLSGNMDKRWRRKVARQFRDVPVEGLILDVACGTGNLALALFEETGARIIGADFCRPMLDIASKKATRVGRPLPFVEGDALRLPFSDSLFDGITIAFGLRNLASVEGGLKELLRVLKPGGKAAVLEFSRPNVPGFSGLFKFYFARVLPLLGGVVSGSKSAYEYLPDSVSRFPNQEKLAAMMRDTGFENVHYLNLTGGIAALHSGTKPSQF